MQCDEKRIILRQRGRGSIRAVRAVQNTRVFQMETSVVANARIMHQSTTAGVNATQM